MVAVLCLVAPAAVYLREPVRNSYQLQGERTVGGVEWDMFMPWSGNGAEHRRPWIWARVPQELAKHKRPRSSLQCTLRTTSPTYLGATEQVLCERQTQQTPAALDNHRGRMGDSSCKTANTAAVAKLYQYTRTHTDPIPIVQPGPQYPMPVEHRESECMHSAVVMDAEGTRLSAQNK